MKTKVKRPRRSYDERIAQMEADLEAVKTRKRLSELRDREGVKQVVVGVRALDRALAEARKSGDAALAAAATAGREPLAAYLDGEGIKLGASRASASEAAA